jgi:DnaJ-class molecular chaperone
MKKRRDFTRDTIEVCRNCKAEGTVEVDSFNGSHKVKCPICGGSGLVRKHIEGYVAVEPYEKNGKA